MLAIHAQHSCGQKPYARFPIHHFARVDFQGFEDVVDAIGSVGINVSCRYEDRLMQRLLGLIL